MAHLFRISQWTHAYSVDLIHTHSSMACIHAYKHTSIHAYKHTSIQAYKHTCIHAYMHTCIHAYMHTCMHVQHACMHAAHSILRFNLGKNTQLCRFQNKQRDKRSLGDWHRGARHDFEKVRFDVKSCTEKLALEDSLMVHHAANSLAPVHHVLLCPLIQHTCPCLRSTGTNMHTPKQMQRTRGENSKTSEA